jgi:hypothetical protein
LYADSFRRSGVPLAEPDGTRWSDSLAMQAVIAVVLLAVSQALEAARALEPGGGIDRQVTGGQTHRY